MSQPKSGTRAPITRAPCTPPTPYPPLLFSVSSLIAVGLALATMGTALNAGGAMPTAKPLLFCYRYFVTFSISDEKSLLMGIIYLININFL